MFIPPESWGFGFTLLFCAVPKTGRVVGAPSGGHSLLSGHPASRWTGRLPFLAAFHAAGPPGCLRHRRRPLSPTSSLNQVPAGAPSVPMDAHAWVSVPCGLSGGCRETVNPRPVGCYLDFSSSPPSDLLLCVSESSESRYPHLSRWESCSRREEQLGAPSGTWHPFMASAGLRLQHPSGLRTGDTFPVTKVEWACHRRSLQWPLSRT